MSDIVPEDIVVVISESLEVSDVISLARSSKRMYQMCQNLQIWRKMLEKTFQLPYADTDAKDIYVTLYTCSKCRCYPPTFPGLRKIILAGHVKLVKMIATTQRRFKRYNLAVNVAINAGQTEICKILLESKTLGLSYRNDVAAFIDRWSPSCRYHITTINAVRTSNFEIIEFLMRKCGEDLWYLMRVCLLKNNTKVLRWLLETYCPSVLLVDFTLSFAFFKTKKMTRESYNMIDALLRHDGPRKHNIYRRGDKDSGLDLFRVAFERNDAVLLNLAYEHSTQHPTKSDALRRAVKLNNIYMVMLVLSRSDAACVESFGEVINRVYVMYAIHKHDSRFDPNFFMNAYDRSPNVRFDDITRLDAFYLHPNVDPNKAIRMMTNEIRKRCCLRKQEFLDDRITDELCRLFMHSSTKSHIDVVINVAHMTWHRHALPLFRCLILMKNGIENIMLDIEKYDREKYKKTVWELLYFGKEFPEIVNRHLCDYIIDYGDIEFLRRIPSYVDLSVDDNYMIKKTIKLMIQCDDNGKVARAKLMAEMAQILRRNVFVNVSLA